MNSNTATAINMHFLSHLDLVLLLQDREQQNICGTRLYLLDTEFNKEMFRIIFLTLIWV